MGRNDENESELHQKNVNIDSESTYDDTDDVQISSPDTVATDGEDGGDVELTSASEIDLPIEEVSEEPEEGQQRRHAHLVHRNEHDVAQGRFPKKR